MRPAGGLGDAGIDGALALGRTAELERGRLSDATAQFEAILLTKVVTAMRATIPRSSDSAGVTGEQIYDHMIEQALATHLADAGGVGVASMLDQALAGGAPARAIQRTVPSSGPAIGADATIGSAGVGHDRPLIDPPLAERLPPDSDPWIHSADAELQLRRMFLEPVDGPGK